MAGLLPALLTSAHLVLGAAPAHNTLQSTTHAVLSAPRESLPRPVHDEATCAFCQAAAFAPHTSRPVAALAIAPGDEHRIQLCHESALTSSAPAGSARSRAPPILRSV